MIRNVTADLYQIGACVEGERGHEAVRVYVLQNEGRPIIIDCGSQLHRAEIMAELDEVLGGAVPAYVFLTHSELPHSGNLQQIAERWPEIQVIVSNILIKYIEIAPILPLDQILTVVPGTTLELAGRELQFINALLRDQPGTQWIYDEQTGTLFTGDGFGYYHSAGACEQFGDEAITDEGLRDYLRDTFRFLRWGRSRENQHSIRSDVRTLRHTSSCSHPRQCHSGGYRCPSRSNEKNIDYSEQRIS